MRFADPESNAHYLDAFQFCKLLGPLLGDAVESCGIGIDAQAIDDVNEAEVCGIPKEENLKLGQ